MRAKFFLMGLRVHWDEGGETVLLGW